MGWIVLLAALSVMGHVLLAAGRKASVPRSLTAGETVPGAWCVPCNSGTAVRVPLHPGPDTGQPPIAHLTVCASCGTRYMPAAPVVTLGEARWHWPRPWTAVLWRIHRRDSARRGTLPSSCAYRDCRKPGWFDCAWYQAVDDGRIRWMFCGIKHRRQWLEIREPASVAQAL